MSTGHQRSFGKTAEVKANALQIGSCGCEISAAKNQINKSVMICSKCKNKCCSSHYYFKVDGNNISITQSHFRNGICLKCLHAQ